MKKRNVVLSIVLVLILLISFFSFSRHTQAVKKEQYVQSSTPTLFFHGYGSSYEAETQMTDAAKSAGVTKKVIRVNVSPNGYVKLIGAIPKKARNPIVEVNFDNNKMTNYVTAGKWVKDVIKELQEDYHFKQVNFVGHSMGNMAINYYIMNYAGKKGQPKVNRVVDIAGHFDGILGMDDKANRLKLAKNGKPDKMNKSYKKLMKL